MGICEEVPNEGQPPAVAGYALSRLNAVQHGLTARSLLLPWEDLQLPISFHAGSMPWRLTPQGLSFCAELVEGFHLG